MQGANGQHVNVAVAADADQSTPASAAHSESTSAGYASSVRPMADDGNYTSKGRGRKRSYAQSHCNAAAGLESVVEETSCATDARSVEDEKICAIMAKNEKPKRPMSSYNFFFRDERAKILAEANAEAGAKGGSLDSSNNTQPAHGRKKRRRGRPHGIVSFQELGKIMGKKWKNIEPKLLEKYTQMAKEDSERYRKEMEEYYARQDDILKNYSENSPAEQHDDDECSKTVCCSVARGNHQSGEEQGAKSDTSTLYAAAESRMMHDEHEPRRGFNLASLSYSAQERLMARSIEDHRDSSPLLRLSSDHAMLARNELTLRGDNVRPHPSNYSTPSQLLDMQYLHSSFTQPESLGPLDIMRLRLGIPLPVLTARGPTMPPMSGPLLPASTYLPTSNIRSGTAAMTSRALLNDIAQLYSLENRNTIRYYPAISNLLDLQRQRHLNNLIYHAPPQISDLARGFVLRNLSVGARLPAPAQSLSEVEGNRNFTHGQSAVRAASNSNAETRCQIDDERKSNSADEKEVLVKFTSKTHH